jgi:hypothetical protein
MTMKSERSFAGVIAILLLLSIILPALATLNQTNITDRYRMKARTISVNKRLACLVLLITISLIIPVVSASGTWINPVMTSNADPAGIANASTENTASSRYAWRAMDHDNSSSNFWLTSASHPTGHIQYRFEMGPNHTAQSTVIDQYRMTAVYTGVETRAPKDWKLEASSTGAFTGEEVILDTRTSQTGWGNLEMRTFSFSNTNGYIWYRLNVTANNGDANYVQILELAFWGYNYTPSGPTTSFSQNQTSGLYPLAVAFTDTSTGTIDSYNWSVYPTGTGPELPVATTRNYTHYFNSGGNYTINFTITNGTQSTAIGYVDVWNQTLAAFAANQTEGVGNSMSVAFTEMTSNATSWYWDFGD